MVGLVLVSHSNALAQAVAEMVRQVSTRDIPLSAVGGVGEDRITLYDNKRDDYETLGMKSVPGFAKVSCLAAAEDGGFGPEVTVGPVTTRLATVLTDKTDVLINLSRLKHHATAGMTAALKNHLGSIPRSGARAFHSCMDRLADLNALEPIRGRTRFALVDALVGIYDKGPSFQPGFTWDAGSLIGSTDPIAADTVALQVLNDHRRSLGRRYATLTPPVTYLARARELGLGAADIEAVEIVKT